MPLEQAGVAESHEWNLLWKFTYPFYPVDTCMGASPIVYSMPITNGTGMVYSNTVFCTAGYFKGAAAAQINVNSGVWQVTQLWILAAMLLPALASGKERAKRIGCVNNVRQFLLAVHMYANDDNQFLPSGASDSNTPDGVQDDSIPILSGNIRTQMIQYAGNDKIMGCPNLGAPFNTQQGFFETGYGFVIGYNYLGGHANTPWELLPGGEA